MRIFFSVSRIITLTRSLWVESGRLVVLLNETFNLADVAGELDIEL
jgi:hypothetical protein